MQRVVAWELGGLGLIWAPLLMSCVTLGKTLHLSGASAPSSERLGLFADDHEALIYYWNLN